jgi:AmiR/NasT family two-component response regulator
MIAAPERRKVQRHILVVDDDRLVLAALAEGLRAAGFAGRDAPDLALLDVRMPGMSGIDLGQHLRERFGVPFLYLSAYGDKGVVQQAVDEGALGYLVKPLDIQQIVPSIEAALQRAGEIGKLRETESQLNTALASSREISMAIGLLMMRDRVNRDQAFDTLRSNARAQRRPLAEVAKELLNSAENLYTIKKLDEKSPSKKGSGPKT